VEDGPNANIKEEEEEEVNIYFLEFTIIDTNSIYYRKISELHTHISPFRLL
jgi:hypothetical protein